MKFVSEPRTRWVAVPAWVFSMPMPAGRKLVLLVCHAAASLGHELSGDAIAKLTGLGVEHAERCVRNLIASGHLVSRGVTTRDGQLVESYVLPDTAPHDAQDGLEPADHPATAPTSATRTDPARWAQMLKFGTKTKEEVVAWVEAVLPKVEAEADAAFPNTTPSSAAWSGKVRSLLWSYWNRERRLGPGPVRQSSEGAAALAVAMTTGSERQR